MNSGNDNSVPEKLEAAASESVEHAENGNLKTNASGIVLVPQPSDDPYDPLNWPSWKKHYALAALSFGSLVCYITGTIVAAGVGQIGTSLKVSYSEAIYVLTTPVIIYAFGPLVWTASSHFTGRRPALLLGTFMSMACCFGCARSSSYAGVLVARYFQALGAAGPLALGPASIRDMYFRHELGKMIGINTILLVISPFIGGIIGGPVIENLGWRWSQWISGILMGAAFVAYLLFVPETVYDRHSSVSQKPWFGFNTPKHRHGKSFLFVLTRPFVMFAYPAVTLPCLWFGLAYMPHVGITSVISLIFEAPPYNFSITQAGLTFFSGLIGAFVGEIFAGPVVDRLAKAAMRGGREYHPEMAYRAVWLGLFTMPVGLLIFGSTIQFSRSWVAPLIGNGTYIFGVEIMTTVVQTYLVECYPEQAVEASLVLNFFRNVFSFLTPFYLKTWIQASGATLPFGIFALIAVITFFPLVLPVIIKGPAIRARSGKPNWGKTA